MENRVNNFADIKKIYTPEEDREVKRGNIYYIKKGTIAGSEQEGDRPAIIVGNQYSPVVIVVYTTTRPKTELPTHVVINSLPQRSVALCEQICTVSKERVMECMGQVTKEEMEQIDKALAVSISLKTAYQKNSSNPLVAEALERIKYIQSVADEVGQVERILVKAEKSDGFGLLNGPEVIKLNGILSEEKQAELRLAIIKQVETSKQARESRLKELLGKVAAEAVPEQKIPPKPVTKKKKADGDGNKRVYLKQNTKAEIEQMYTAGKEMDDIAVAVGMDIVAVSKYISSTDLPAQRYAGKTIPSVGSASIKKGSTNLSGRKR